MGNPETGGYTPPEAAEPIIEIKDEVADEITSRVVTESEKARQKIRGPHLGIPKRHPGLRFKR